MKTLYIDVETAPNLAHVWGLFRQTVSISQLMESSRVICFAAKWRGDRKVTFHSEFTSGREVMLDVIHSMMDEADVLVHYNGNSFDVPTINKEFVLRGMTPPAPAQQLDLYRVIRKKFRFPSNKLAYVSQALGLVGKLPHEGHELWVKCLAGDPKAWRVMERYNKRDVTLLEDLHDAVLPWISNHPNARLVNDDEGVCPNCGTSSLRKEGFTYTQVGKYQRFQCRNCGAWSRSGRRSAGTDLRGTA